MGVTSKSEMSHKSHLREGVKFQSGLREMVRRLREVVSCRSHPRRRERLPKSSARRDRSSKSSARRERSSRSSARAVKVSEVVGERKEVFKVVSERWRVRESIENFDIGLGRLRVPAFLFLTYTKRVRPNSNRTRSNRSQAIQRQINAADFLRPMSRRNWPKFSDNVGKKLKCHEMMNILSG